MEGSRRGGHSSGGRWEDPDATVLLDASSEGGIDGEDLPVVDPPDGPGLGDVAADLRKGDLVVDERIGLGEGEILRRRPDGGTTARRLERHQGRPERAPAEEEVPGRCHLGPHLHAPVQVVAFGLLADEGACVHGAAP